MTGISGNFNKMFRWLKDKKKSKHDKKVKVEDDYGFRKKQIIVEETENGHSVIIKDAETTLVYPQSFCRFHFRARMPTPVQNFRETSSHIYDEIPEHSVRTRLEYDRQNLNEADLIKDTRPAKEQDSKIDLQNAIEVGPYLIVPIVNPSNGDVELLKTKKETLPHPCNETDVGEVPTEDGAGFISQNHNECNLDINTSAWHQSVNSGISKDTKVVLTRCVKTRSGLKDASNIHNDCHTSVLNNGSDLCSFKKGAQNMQCDFRIFADSPSADSNSRTLTGTPDSSTRTPDTLSERSDSCAILEETDEDIVDSTNAIAISHKVDRDNGDGNETCYEYDLSTSGESEQSRNSEQSDYELYLSKIESNLELKHNVRKLVQDIDSDVASPENDKADNQCELESMTYVSSLSEYSSAASHISNVSADRSESDDSSGYYECFEETRDSKSKTKDACGVNLERSVSAPEGNSVALKNKFAVCSKRHKKSKTGAKSYNHRSKSFDKELKGVYKALSDEDKELYKFPSSSNSGSSMSSRHGRGNTVLAPQPTPVYMDPYRGKTGRHNRLLGDLIRMNYDKQLFFH